MPAGLTVHVGMSGAGKTYALRQEVWALIGEGRTVVVIDRMSEWEGVPPQLAPHTAGVRSKEQAEAAIKAQKRLIVWRPGLGRSDSATEAACKLVCLHPGPTGIAVAEAHSAWPKAFGADPDQYWRSAVITEWRHHDVAVIADSQRFARLNTDLVELARTLRLFAMNGRNDLARCVEVGGRGLEEAVKQCADKLSTGEPGWHVLLGTSRPLQYEITRYGSNERSPRQAQADTGDARGEAARGTPPDRASMGQDREDPGPTDRQ